MTIKEMLAERKRLLEEAKATQATADSEDHRELTEDEEATIAENLAAAKDLETKIGAARANQVRQAELLSQLADTDGWENQHQPQQTRLPMMPAVHTTPAAGGLPVPGGAATFPSFGERLIAVRNAVGQHPSEWDQRLLPQGAASGLNESVGSEGGFLVGADESQELLQRMYAGNQILAGGAGYSGPTRVPISANANSVKFKALDETSRANGSRWGGIQASWIEEAGTKPATKPAFRQMELSLKKLVGLYYATDELLQDSAALESLVLNWFAQEFAFKIQDALLNGTGAGTPQGILPANCLVSQAKETGQAAATIVKENIDKMWSRMWPSGIGNSVWLINQQCYPQLFSLSQAVGTGGMPVYMPPGGLSASPYGTLLGRPVVPVEQCQALGTKGDILFCDWSQMLFADKGGLQSASSIHIKFVNDETAYRFVYRCDSQPAWNAPLTPYKGGSTATTGPFIALDSRS